MATCIDLKKSKKACAVKFCPEENATSSFKFPKNEKIGVLWVQAIQNENSDRILEKEGYSFIHKK